ncbi:MAG: hypothetical protein BJ554DRAFT_7373 [Olpidium bornovanus]|uniref:G-patch domain-containing protein n=1 Tax=Olpidium bornovanus TaxID=278681 RepID=A0A8H7ZWK9_9FUNG|nr:MAG: hypothetical protein BJ554DRAFT_7373 [Olpidium bornovanus]
MVSLARFLGRGKKKKKKKPEFFARETRVRTNVLGTPVVAMGLAGQKKTQRIGADPRNLAWSSGERGPNGKDLFFHAREPCEGSSALVCCLLSWRVATLSLTSPFPPPLQCPRFEDQSNFGFRMLAKMGWTPGSGLGVDGQGVTRHVAVKLKDDNLGVGATKKTIDKWLDNTDAFSALLKTLNDRSPAAGTGDGESTGMATPDIRMKKRRRDASDEVHNEEDKEEKKKKKKKDTEKEKTVKDVEKKKKKKKKKNEIGDEGEEDSAENLTGKTKKKEKKKEMGGETAEDAAGNLGRKNKKKMRKTEREDEAEEDSAETLGGKKKKAKKAGLNGFVKEGSESSGKPPQSPQPSVTTNPRLPHRAKFLRQKKAAFADAARLAEILGIKDAAGA